jgi:hypothetical protein
MKILLPVDGSKSSTNAAKYVGKLAKDLRSKCTVTLISIHDDIGLGHVKQLKKHLIPPALNTIW